MNKTFYNAVVNLDLYYLIYEYIRSHYQVVVHKYAIEDWHDLDNAVIDTWKSLGTDAVNWLESEQLPKMYQLTPNDDSPGSDTWGILYYQTLAYIDRNYKTFKSLRYSTEEEQRQTCIDCINDLKNLVTEIREVTEEDI